MPATLRSNLSPNYRDKWQRRWQTPRKQRRELIFWDHIKSSDWNKKRIHRYSNAWYRQRKSKKTYFCGLEKDHSKMEIRGRDLDSIYIVILMIKHKAFEQISNTPWEIATGYLKNVLATTVTSDFFAKVPKSRRKTRVMTSEEKEFCHLVLGQQKTLPGIYT